MLQIRLILGLLLGTLLTLDAAAQVLVALLPVGTGSVSGRVMSRSSEPLGEATVTLRLFNNSVSAAAQWTTRTDPDGTFEFNRLPVGPYQIVPEKAGYSSIEITAPANIHAGREFQLATGERTYLDLVLRPAGTISGRVTRPDGTPAPDAEVMAAVRREDGRAVGVQRRARADADGRYQITEVPAGSFLVRAQDDTRNVDNRGKFYVTLYPGVPESDAGGLVTVGEDEAIRGVDVRLLGAAPQHPLSGQLLDEEGRALRDARLTFWEVSGGRQVVSGQIQSDGRFTTLPLARGTVLMLAHAMTDDGLRVGAGSVEIGEGATEMAPVLVRRPGTIIGQIVTEGTAPSGMSLRPLTVFGGAEPTSPTRSLSYGEDFSSGADGTFRLEGIIGRQLIQVGPLPPGWVVKNLLRHGAALPDRIVTVAPGEMIDGIEIIVGPLAR